MSGAPRGDTDPAERDGEGGEARGPVPAGDPAARFSSRVEDYVRHRPSYPPQAIELLRRECGLAPGARVADLGSGTGILSRLLLEAGVRVAAVEPNPEMRHAAERLLGSHDRFASVAGRAEATGLAAASCDLAVAAQAFHWFDQAAARRELGRILRPGGRFAILWNERRKDSTPFLRDYEGLLLEFGTDYREVDHSRIRLDEMRGFFAPFPMRSASFPNRQALDFAGLRGRLLSSSYTPAPGHPAHGPMLSALETLFRRHQRDGRVALQYETRVHYGRLT